MGKIFSDFFNRLAADRTLRERFAEDPASVLAKEGYDPALLDLPTRIDLRDLEKRLEDAFSDKFHPTVSEDETRSLSADELWQRFSMIRPKAEAGVGPVTGVPVTAVVYGTVATAAIFSMVGTDSSLVSEDQVRTLRLLEGLDESDVTVSITGPNGVRVGNLSLRAAEAFLKQLQD